MGLQVTFPLPDTCRVETFVEAVENFDGEAVGYVEFHVASHQDWPCNIRAFPDQTGAGTWVGNADVNHWGSTRRWLLSWLDANRVQFTEG